MRNDLCKKCGTEMLEFHRCMVCKKACKFVCPNCMWVSDDQFHLQCVESVKKLNTAATS